MYVMTTYQPTPNNIPSPEGFCVAVIFVVAVYGQILYLDATFRTKLINLDLETEKGPKESEKAFQAFLFSPKISPILVHKEQNYYKKEMGVRMYGKEICEGSHQFKTKQSKMEHSKTMQRNCGGGRDLVQTYEMRFKGGRRGQKVSKKASRNF